MAGQEQKDTSRNSSAQIGILLGSHAVREDTFQYEIYINSNDDSFWREVDASQVAGDNFDS